MVKIIQRLFFLLLLIIVRRLCKKRTVWQYNLIEENTMGLIYDIQVPVPTAFDVTKRVVKIKVDDHESEFTLSNVETVLTTQPIKEGSVVTLSVKNIDNAGNESEWSDPYTFTATDTLAPPKSGPVSAVLVGETPEEPTVITADVVVSPIAPTPPPPEPEPEPEVEPE